MNPQLARPWTEQDITNYVRDHGKNRKTVSGGKQPRKQLTMKGSSKVYCKLRRSEKATQVLTWNSCLERNKKIPKEHRTPHQETTIQPSGTRNCTRFQDRPEVPTICHCRSTRGCRGIPHGTV